MKRVYLDDETAVRTAIAALARYACNGDVGRIKGDPVFEEVTEKRQACWLVNGSKRCYSGCGDLPQWALWRALGATVYPTKLPWVNRAEAWGWKPGANISRLVYSTGAAWNMAKPGECPAPRQGDVILVGNNTAVGGFEHVFVVGACMTIAGDPNPTLKLSSYDYGQFLQPAGASHADHGGVACTRTAQRRSDGRWWAFGTNPPGRPIIGWLDAYALWNAAQSAIGGDGLEAALVPDDFTGGRPSDNPY